MGQVPIPTVAEHKFSNDVITIRYSILQVGDKVTKGQVVCIVEAMKLMNEIEVSTGSSFFL